jgi:DNA mismatch endonuclease (patch repair protein)
VVDGIAPDRRSENMRRIRSMGMKPEMLVRRLVHRMGYRFRLHAKDLPGKPDLVFRSRKKVIFVHGCFWHQHQTVKCPISRRPQSNPGYWGAKLARNVERDAEHLAALRKAGWKVLVVWECETENGQVLEKRLRKFLGPMLIP